MFDQSLLVENKFTQFILSKLLSFLVYTEFTQVYPVCTEFTPNLHRVYFRTIFFLLGKPPRSEMWKLSVSFEQSMQTLSKQTCIYLCQFV
jgi:hypothetical protein